MDKMFWSSVAGSHEAISPVRYACRDKKKYGAYIHDFYEFFWVDEGVCIHDIKDKGSFYLQTNELSLVWPGEVHEFISTSTTDCRFSLISVLINARHMNRLMQRYPDIRQFLEIFDHSDNNSVVLSISQKENLYSGIEKLSQRKESRFEDDLFIFNLLNEIHITEEQAIKPACPDWLEETINKMRLRKNFSLGSGQYAVISGRCYEHISRMMKKYLSITPNQLLQQFRMEYAIERLSNTDEPIIDIALSCGYESLSQFYKVFHEHFNTTPHRYRLEGSHRHLTITTVKGD